MSLMPTPLAEPRASRPIRGTPRGTPPLFIDPTTPSEEDYITWIYNIMGVDPNALASDSYYIDYTYTMSLQFVNEYIDWVNPIVYTQAVYNLGGHFLVQSVQDDTSLTPPYNTYWQDLRQTLGFNNFIPGLINATNDEDTSAAILTPTSLQNLTLGDMQMLKSPWGRAYLAIAQCVGSMWGLS